MTESKKAVTVPADEGWVTDSDESPTQIKFDKVGDVFTGIKVGRQTLQSREEEDFTVYLFRAAAGMPGLEEGELCSISESHKLKKLADVKDGRVVRITYVKNVDVGRPQPMRDFRIDSREA